MQRRVCVIRQLVLRALRGQPELLDRRRVRRHVDAARLAHVAHEVSDERAIDIVAAEECIAGRREHLEHTGFCIDDRDVERAAAEVIDEIAAIRTAVRAVAERGSCRLAEQPYTGGS